MQDVTDPFSHEAQRVLAAAMVAGLLMILDSGLLVLGAPLAMLIWPVLVAAGAMLLVRREIRHVRRHGWWSPGEEPGGSGRGDGPDEPLSPGPSGEPLPTDWERFESQFWEQVEAQRLARTR
jgi:hypothetical protein